MKIIVFDSGWGGDVVADYLEQALPIEIERLIDWKKGSYGEKSVGEIRLLTEMALLPHIGKAELIVLAETVVALSAIDYLKKKYPGQIFVGYGRELAEIVRKLSRTMILTTEGTKRLERYQEFKASFSCRELVEPECMGWSEKIDDGEFSGNVLMDVVGNFRGTVIVYSSGFIDAEAQIMALAGKRVDVIDMRRVLLRDVCSALKLKGVDGRTPKERFKCE